MKPNQTLDEARKYLLYVADALNAVANAYSTDRADRSILEKYASDLFEYSNNIDKLKNNIIAREETKKKIQIVAELEEKYENHKRVAVKAKKNLQIVQARLKAAQESGSIQDIEEWKQRVAYYTKQNLIAQQNEFVAKRDFEQGA